MVFHIPQKDVQKLESIQKLVLNVCLKSWDGSYSTYKLVISHALRMDERCFGWCISTRRSMRMLSIPIIILCIPCICYASMLNFIDKKVFFLKSFHYTIKQHFFGTFGCTIPTSFYNFLILVLIIIISVPSCPLFPAQSAMFENSLFHH